MRVGQFFEIRNTSSPEYPVEILAVPVSADVVAEHRALVHVDAGGPVLGPRVAVAHLALAGERAGLVEADAVVAQGRVVGALVWGKY